MVSKIVKAESRATLFGAFSMIGSIGILFINKLGGYLYTNVDKKWPFYIILISYSITIVLVIILKLLNKLKV